MQFFIMITSKTLKAPVVLLQQYRLWSAGVTVYTGSIRIAGKAFYRLIICFIFGSVHQQQQKKLLSSYFAFQIS